MPKNKKSKIIKERTPIIPSDSDSESDEVPYSQAAAEHTFNMSLNDEDLRIDKNTLVRQYAELKYDIKQVFNKLECVERLLHNIASGTGSGTILDNGERSFLDQLPLASITEIDNFDAAISESAEKFNSLVQLLYLVGGDTNKKIIYNILNKLITNHVAQFYSGQGRKHKLSFMKFKLYDAVTVATRRRQPSITDVEIKQITSQFLATAPSRIKDI